MLWFPLCQAATQTDKQLHKKGESIAKDGKIAYFKGQKTIVLKVSKDGATEQDHIAKHHHERKQTRKNSFCN